MDKQAAREKMERSLREQQVFPLHVLNNILYSTDFCTLESIVYLFRLGPLRRAARQDGSGVATTETAAARSFHVAFTLEIAFRIALTSHNILLAELNQIIVNLTIHHYHYHASLSSKLF